MDTLVESGEGIESFVQSYQPPLNLKWNPVKELKEESRKLGISACQRVSGIR